MAESLQDNQGQQLGFMGTGQQTPEVGQIIKKGESGGLANLLEFGQSPPGCRFSPQWALTDEGFSSLSSLPFATSLTEIPSFWLFPKDRENVLTESPTYSGGARVTVVRHQEHLRKCSPTGAGGRSCFLEGRPPPATPPAPPFQWSRPVCGQLVLPPRVLHGLLLVLRAKLKRHLFLSQCLRTPGWTPRAIPVILLMDFLTCCYQTLAYLLPVARKEGPCLFLHYYSSGATCSAWHAAGCLPLLAE